MEFVPNKISIGIEEDIIGLDSKESLVEYEKFLCNIFPENKEEIHHIVIEMHNIMRYMDVLYGIDNPLFLDLSENREYVLKTLLPWLFKYQVNIRKAMNLDKSINDYLLKFTHNQFLIDMITQHFFKDTPTFFALSYFGVYLDYIYPFGGTCVLVEKLSDCIKNNGGDILTKTEISAIEVEKNRVKTIHGKSFGYKKLVWSGDSSRLYNIINYNKNNTKTNKNIEAQKSIVEGSYGGDSILTIYIGVNMDKSYFRERQGQHLFYTPKSIGLSSVSLEDWDKFTIDTDLKDKIASYLERTTYEISCPVLRDKTLAPSGKTGLIVSTLFNYNLVKEVRDAGWYEEFKEFCTDKIIEVLSDSIFKNLKDNIIFSICSTPLTLEKFTGNLHGAITGWAFNSKMPSEKRLNKINKSVLTPIPNIYQAGQWTFSPSGVPISILTGKLAADRIKKELQKNKNKKDKNKDDI